MTGYELSKNWFDWAFENPDLNSPTTTALYMWAIEKWNRMSQKPKFGFPASEAMEAIGIKSYNTYKKALSELVELGAIEMIQESKNQYTANIIALLKFDKAHTKALAKHLIKQIESTGESSSSIDKPITLEPITLEPIVIAPQPAVASTPKAKPSLNERKDKFKETLVPFVETYGREMLNAFFAYWTEQNKSATAFRYEKEKFWDLPKRLATWHRNEKSRNGTYQSKESDIPALPKKHPLQNLKPREIQMTFDSYQEYEQYCRTHNLEILAEI
jgi:hypothetical protein